MEERKLLDLWARVGETAGTGRARVLAVELAHVPDPQTSSLGEVNRALLQAWRGEFGDRLECVATCPACEQRLEAELSAAAILARQPSPASSSAGLRAPTLDDLDEAAATGSAEEAKRELARRCAGGDVPLEDVSAALEALDPHLAIRLSLHCPACNAAFMAVVDVAEHVWASVDRRARVVMTEVAELAAAYGWTEQDVLRLPAARRRAYAERAAR
jgi:hypothetical protein